MSYYVVPRSRANFVTYEYKRTRVFVTPAYDYEVFENCLVRPVTSNDFRIIIDGDQHCAKRNPSTRGGSARADYFQRLCVGFPDKN